MHSRHRTNELLINQKTVSNGQATSTVLSPGCLSANLICEFTKSAVSQGPPQDIDQLDCVTKELL